MAMVSGITVATSFAGVGNASAIYLPSGEVPEDSQQVKDISETYINLAEGVAIAAKQYSDVVTVSGANIPGEVYTYTLNINMPALKENYTEDSLLDNGFDEISYSLWMVLTFFDELNELANDNILTIEDIWEVDKDNKEYVISTMYPGGNEVTEGEEWFSIPYMTYERSSSVVDFVDVKHNSWAKKSIDNLVGLGIVSGTSATTYSPETKITRAQFAAMLSRSIPNATAVSETTPFKDVKEENFAAYDIQLLNELGIVSGTSATTFGPNENITREQATAMIVRYLDAIGVDTSDVSTAITFNDSKKISDYAKESVGKLSNLEVIKGFEGNYFAPKDYLTRGQMAKILDSTLDLVVE